MRAFATFITLVSVVAFADSPLTSIDFSTAYRELPAVQSAKQGNVEAAYAYLASTADNGSKLAVANALGWQGDFATGFFEFLAAQRHVSPKTLDARDLDASQRFVAGFLVASASYLDLKPLDPRGQGVWRMKGVELLQQAAKELPNDFAVQYALALVQAQATMSNAKAWCQVFRGPDAVLQRFPTAQRNLRPGAVESAQGYLNSYEEYCPTSSAAKRKQIDELNQIYTLSRVGRQIVAGAQGGIVVWDPELPKPVAVREGFICRGVEWKGSAWVGCESDVVRWDGTKFTSFLGTKQKGVAVYYEPMRGPDGSLWVRRGKQTWAWDEQAARFVTVTPPWKTDVYDAHFAKGRWFWVEFLRGVHTSERTFALKSPEYPGTDPRMFTEDETGAVWVQDFESGLFLFDGVRFVKVPGIDAKASGVAVDVERKRTWMLHYTDGLTLVHDGGKTERIALQELENMRALLLDTNGDVWVSGWTQLVRVRPDGPTWVKQRFIVK